MARRPAADSAVGLPRQGGGGGGNGCSGGCRLGSLLLGFGGLGLGFRLAAGLVLFGLDRCRDLFHYRRRYCGAGRHAGATFGKLLAKLVVLLVQAAQFDDDFVQEVVNFVLVVAFAELGRLKALVDNVFWRQSHLVTSLV